MNAGQLFEFSHLDRLRMSTWVLTNIHAAIEQELDMNEWLIEHNLTSIQHFLTKHNITLDELAKYDNEDAEFVLKSTSLIFYTLK